MKINRMPSHKPFAIPNRIEVVHETKTGCLPFIIGFVLILVAIILIWMIMVIGGCSLYLSKQSRMQHEGTMQPQSTVTNAGITSSVSNEVKPNANLYSFSESKDAMTDATRYIFAWQSEKSREKFSLTREALILRFSPTEVSRSTHKMKYDIDCYFIADFAFVSDKPANVSVRFDNKPAQTWKCTPSSSNDGYFIQDAKGFLAEIAYARRARVRFMDFGGNQRDLDFNLGFFSLQNFREQIVACVLKSKPPNVSITE